MKNFAPIKLQAVMEFKSQVYLDVSSLTDWSKSPVGISRIEFELARYCLAQQQWVSFCRYESALAAYVHVSTQRIEEDIRQFGAGALPTSSTNASQPRARLSRLKQQLRPWLPPRLFAGLNRPRWMLRRQPKAPVQDSIKFRAGDRLIWMSISADASKLKLLRSLAMQDRVQNFFYCHDIIPIIFPQYVGIDYVIAFGQYLKVLAETATGLMFNSRASQEDFQTHYPMARMPQTIINPAVGDLLPLPNGSVSSDVQAVLESPFILYVSTIEPRKNHDVLYRAYVKAHQQDIKLPKLVCLGRQGWLIDDQIHYMCHDPRVIDSIVFLHEASDHELALLYRRCLFTVYPSFYEGWGMPVSEALSLGKFCLISGCGGLADAGAIGCMHIDPHDALSWLEWIKFYATHEDALSEKEAFIRERYASENWHDFSKKIMRFAQENSYMACTDVG
ncbi:MAG: glycosyltransferase family 1 protein [Pseudomonadota bacterium]